jgi:hypothetical protein
MNDSPVLLHVWNVREEHENALVDRIREMFRRVADQPGFVSARVLASPDRTSVAALVEMRSAEDRERLQALAEVRELLADMRGAYNLTVRLYREIETYGNGRPGRSPAPR